MVVHLSGAGGRIERPRWVWLAVGIELFTGLAALPVGHTGQLRLWGGGS